MASPAVAEQLAGRPILHLANDEADIYFVEDSGFVYTYQPGAAPSPVPASAPFPALNLLARPHETTRRLSGHTLAASLVIAALLAGAAVGGEWQRPRAPFPQESFGQGSSPTSTYAVSSIAYKLNANSPQNIDQVAFTISPTTARVVDGSPQQHRPRGTAAQTRRAA